MNEFSFTAVSNLGHSHKYQASNELTNEQNESLNLEEPRATRNNGPKKIKVINQRFQKPKMLIIIAVSILLLNLPFLIVCLLLNINYFRQQIDSFNSIQLRYFGLFFSLADFMRFTHMCMNSFQFLVCGQSFRFQYKKKFNF